MKFLTVFLFLLFLTFLSCNKDKEGNTLFDNSAGIIPQIYINVDQKAEVNTKDYYLMADIVIDGKSKYKSHEGRTGIKGRGNSTWDYPKKPYKIKLETATPLFGMEAYKSWILLAEYLDGSMLYNSIPFETAKMLGMPYTSNVVPVELTINNEYKGFYVLTEDKEVGPGRIDIGNGGLLLELDVFFDEDWQFKSENFNLPVMVKYPKAVNMTNDKLDNIKSNFEIFEALVADPSFPNNNYLDYFEDLSFVNYMIVYQLTHNRELNSPKSTYINKKAGGKYRMGIVWDFDWAFGFPGTDQHFDLSSVNESVIENGSAVGTVFFRRLMTDPHLQSLFKERWNWFKAHKFEKLKKHVENYAELVRQAMKADHEIWGPRDSSGDIDVDLKNTLTWLDARANYIDNYVASFE
ncbi:MAG TPA: CotH kinase family protein [Brumimicrobium sp.]|nr:CotH kinase family protein [Brumimicrobium sp.]